MIYVLQVQKQERLVREECVLGGTLFHIVESFSMSRTTNTTKTMICMLFCFVPIARKKIMNTTSVMEAKCHKYGQLGHVVKI